MPSTNLVGNQDRPKCICWVAKKYESELSIINIWAWFWWRLWYLTEKNSRPKTDIIIIIGPYLLENVERLSMVINALVCCDSPNWVSLVFCSIEEVVAMFAAGSMWSFTMGRFKRTLITPRSIKCGALPRSGWPDIKNKLINSANNLKFLTDFLAIFDLFINSR